MRLKFTCPGYGHQLDVVLRDQTARVVGRYHNRNRNHDHNSSPRRNESPRPSSSSSSYKSIFNPLVTFLPKELPHSIESHSLAFLFSTAPKRDHRTSHGHLDFLRPLYNNVNLDSPLALATSWLGMLLLTTESTTCGPINQSRSSHCEESERNLTIKMLQSIRSAINDPVLSMKTETLTAVILVTYGEYIRKRDRIYGHGYDSKKKSTIMAAFMIHQEGAEALIRRRGRLNFQDEISLALFNAVRHNAVNIAMVSGIPPSSPSSTSKATTGTAEATTRKPGLKNWDLWTLCHDSGFQHLCDSYTPATELDACAVTMVTLRNRLANSNNSNSSNSSSGQDGHDFSKMDLREDLQRLLERLRSWHDHVPHEWLPRHEGPAGGNGSPSDYYAYYPSSEVTFLFCQWYLLQLETMHWLRELDETIRTDTRTGTGTRTNTNTAANIKNNPDDYSREIKCIHNIISSEYSMLGIPPTPTTSGTHHEKENAKVNTSFPFPHTTPHQCHDSPIGSRFLGQILDRLDMILSQALETLNLPLSIKLFYTEVVSWSRREGEMIRSAFPV